ncbi:rhodanese-like domain-containing protein [Kitasatospora sp. NBC_01250]|uniref:rhodanese-like domain-containing protein n=1 Tax=unclassified Kitasatospora TaxID=2633591 RepID=UPI002E0D3255|nr:MULTISPECIES: rhodanese-like domain-containing protein [unclassified Kitasatospora]WSJ68370.1 rhodanese-like domain-containing protein [Kitasatospora sp. NBC_01302]
MSPVRWADPERQRLEERVAATELAWLTLEVDVETLRVEIDNFALVHHERLGPLYARIDELEALIAEAVAARTGSPEDLRRAVDARRMVDELPDLDALFDSVRQAEEQAAQAVGDTDEAAGQAGAAQPPRRVRPGKEAQRLYRELARRAHPDLSTDPAEQQRRSAFIARANEAYARGDAAALEALTEEWSTAPESAPEPDAPDRGEWLLQRLEWLGARIAELATEQVRLEGTAMGSLLALAPGDPDQLLAELAEQLLAKAAAQQQELTRLLAVDNGAPVPAPRPSSVPEPSTQQESPSMFQQIPTVQVDNVPADAVLIDVREQDEWDAGHAEGALHIPMSQFTARLDEVPEAPLYVVCRVGGRSAQVVQYLVGQERQAFNVDGGMFAWAQAGRPMVSGSGEEAYVL